MNPATLCLTRSIFFVYKWSISHRKKNTFIDKEFNTVFEAFSPEREINAWCGPSGHFVLEYVFLQREIHCAGF